MNEKIQILLFGEEYADIAKNLLKNGFDLGSDKEKVKKIASWHGELQKRIENGNIKEDGLFASCKKVSDVVKYERDVGYRIALYLKYMGIDVPNPKYMYVYDDIDIEYGRCYSIDYTDSKQDCGHHEQVYYPTKIEPEDVVNFEKRRLYGRYYEPDGIEVHWDYSYKETTYWFQGKSFSGGKEDIRLK